MFRPDLVRFRFASLMPLALSFVLLLSIIAFLTDQSSVVEAAGNILYVEQSGSCGLTPCYSSIQAAVDAAADGDEVRVAAGTYTGVNSRAGLSQILYIDKTVTIRGGYTTANWTVSDPATNVTTLNAQSNGRVIYITGSISPIVEGLRITGGNANGLGGDPWFGHGAGGGIYVVTATATISNNLIEDNSTSSFFGGGVYLNRSSTLLYGNTIDNNSAGNGGGVGIWFGGNTLTKNTITNNSQNGIWQYGYLTTFSQNIISGNSSNFNGGGVELYYGGAYFDRNVIQQNTASSNGGGVALWTYGGAEFDGDIISGNTAGTNGGGIYISSNSNSDIYNTVIADNEASGSGSGLFVDSSTVDVIHTTFARNSNGDGRAIYVDSKNSIYSTVMMTNTIIATHTTGLQVTNGNTVHINAVLWYQNPTTVLNAAGATVSVQNALTGDPAFAGDGYHLTINSAALNAGVSSKLDLDIDDQARALGGLPDLGADELIATLAINFDTGAPGSFFTLTGSNFPPNDTATIMLNGRILGTVPTDASGGFIFLLNSAGADEGAYRVTATVNPTANLWFSLNAAALTHLQNGSGTIFDIPTGIAFDQFTYLPIIIK